MRKTIVALLMSVSLVSVSLSGVLPQPALAQAKTESKTSNKITITKDDCVQLEKEAENIPSIGSFILIRDDISYVWIPKYEMYYSLGVVKDDTIIQYEYGGSVYKLIVTISEYSDLPFVTDFYSVTEKKKVIQGNIDNLVIHKPVEVPEVTLTASEKKGILVVKKGDIKTAVKFDKILRGKNIATIKIKASTKKKAKSIMKSLQDNLGYVNTYGLKVGDGDKHIVINNHLIVTNSTYSLENYLRKQDKYYTLKISRNGMSEYVNACKAFKKTFADFKSEFSLPEGVHLCDLSDTAKAYICPSVVSRVFKDSGASYKNSVRNLFGVLSDSKVYKHKGETSNMIASVGEALGLDVKTKYFSGVVSFSTNNSRGESLEWFNDNGDWFTSQVTNNKDYTTDFDAVQYLIGELVL